MPSQWLSVAAAREKIIGDIAPIADVADVAVEDALMRVNARDVVAPFNVPGHDNSAMDGFACRFADIKNFADGGDVALRVAGASFAGHPFVGAFARGECVRIMTGARLPDGADIVIPQEETRCDADNGGESVVINIGAQRRAGMHLRRAGEDLQKGAVALPAGALCHPAHLGLLASLGVASLRVKRRLRVAFFSTGDEVKVLGESLGEDGVYDSNRHTLRAMLQRMGFEAMDFAVVKDDKAALMGVISEAAETADVIVTSGGASVGEADHIRSVLAELGKVLFWKVAMRPGRPLAFGKVGNADFFGLPGNPVSVMVCFYQFVREALWKRAGRIGAPPMPTLPATTTTALRKSSGRTEFQRAVLTAGGDGEWQVTVTGDQGSGILSSMTRANCFIVLPEECGKVGAGATVQVQPFEGII